MTIDEIHTHFDLRWATACAQSPRKVTCSVGCSACCAEPLYTSFEEARVAVANVPKDKRQQVIDRTGDWLHSAQASGILKEEEPNVMTYKAVRPLLVCPLLHDNLCLAYAHRPFGCRSHCAVGEPRLCVEDRLSQQYATAPMLLLETSASLFCHGTSADHFGVWLSRFLLGSEVRSAAYTRL